MKFSRQTTLRSQATVTGVGVHSGLPVSLTIGPAPIDAGFIFVRTGLDGCDREVQATAESVIATEFATVLGDREGPLVSTAEHVLAALRGMGVDNATIEVDGPEVPIMDGSAAAFVAAIDQAGVLGQSAPRRFIEVLRPVQVAMGDCFGELRPHAAGFRAEVEIDFANPVIGRQKYTLDLSPERFRREICRARTFGFLEEVESMRAAGLARGGSLDNAVVVSGNRVLNDGGLRYADEFVRHKLLDALGDLYLAGAPILGHFRGVRSGHALTRRLLLALFADKDAWCKTTLAETVALGALAWPQAESVAPV